MKRITCTLSLTLLIGVSSCSASQSAPQQNLSKDATTTLPVSAYPQGELSITPAANMTKQEMFNTCSETITSFVQSNPCKTWDAYHALFSMKSRSYLATPMAEDDPACDMKESVKILQILPVEEWWRLENTGKDIPEAAKSTLPNEQVFYVEVETTWRPGVVPPSQNPGTMLMWMLPEDGKCLIRDYGW